MHDRIAAMSLKIPRVIRDNEMNISVAVSYINLFLTSGTSIIITPLLIRSLGASEYGLYMLVYSVAMYLNVEGFGIGGVVVRHVKAHLMLDENEQLEDFLFWALLVFIIIAGLSVLFLSGISLGADAIFSASIESANISRFKSMLSIMAVHCSFMFLSNYMISVISGYQRFLLVRLVMLCKILGRTSFIILTAGTIHIETLVVLEAVVSASTFVIYAAYALFTLKIRIRPHRFGGKAFAPTFKRTFFIFISLVTDNINWNGGSLIVAMSFGTAASGIFAVAMTLTAVFTQFSTTISGLFLPGITELVVGNAPKSSLLARMTDAGRYLLMLLALIILGFLFVGEDFLVFFLGEAFRESYYIALPLMITLLYPAMQFIGENIMQAFNRYNQRSAMYMASAAMSLALSFQLIPRVDIRLAWIGLSVPVILFRICGMNVFYRRLGLDILAFFRSTMPRMILVFAVCAPCLWLCFWLFSPIFIVRAAIITVAYTVSVWFFYMNAEEKRAVTCLLRRKKDYD